MPCALYTLPCSLTCTQNHVPMIRVRVSCAADPGAGPGQAIQHQPDQEPRLDADGGQ